MKPPPRRFEAPIPSSSSSSSPPSTISRHCSRGIRSVAPATPLIGCSTAGEIATDGPSDASVVVTAIGGAGYSVTTKAARNASSDLRRAGATAATCAENGAAGDNQILLLLTDGLGGDQQEVVRGAYSVVGGSVPLVGGCAGDDLAMRKTFQLFDDEVLEDSVLAAAITSDAPFGIGVQHGWGRVGAPFLVTSSSGTRVFALDDRPALDVYLERLEAPEDVRTDPAAFTRFALTHPFGLSRRSGEEVRFIAEANFDDRSIGCIAEVPQGGLAWIMEGDADSVLQATATACSQAVDGLSGHAPLGFLAFDCIARRGVLGDTGIRKEVESDQVVLAGVAGCRLLHLRRDRAHSRRQRIPQSDAGGARLRLMA